MQKRILSIILALSLMFSLAAVTSITASAESFTSGDFEYEILDDGTVEITDYTGSAETLKIPNEIDGKTVTSIGDSAFAYCYPLTSVTIPDSVTTIGNYAFEDCDSLTSVTIGNSVTSIGEGAFANCDSLTSVTIPDSVTTIGDSAFAWCDSLTSVTIGNSVTTIGDSAFYDCISLTSVTIPDSVTSIGDSAFWNCYSLTSVTIPDSVTTIGDSAFRGCTSLTSVTIPDSVTTIGGFAFYDCDSLTSVTIPDSVTTIGDSAFYDCYPLTSVTIPDSVTTIGDGAFAYCYSLTSVDVSVDNKNYSSQNGVLFNKDKTMLIQYPIGKEDKEYTIPDSVTTIGDYAFEYCESLTSVTIPDSVTTIGDEAFMSCHSLKSVTIGNSVTTIGDHAFYNTALYNNEANWENGVLYIGNYLIDVITEVSGEYIIKDGTKVIADWAFEDCKSLTSVTIPDSVTTIGNYAFYDCDSLTSVTIPDSVTSIGDSAFCGCDSLTSVTIPDSVTSIGDSAFGYCYDDDWNIIKTPNFHIYCYKDTAAEQYAIDNEFDYTLLDGSTTPTKPTITVTQPTAGSIKKTENGDGTVTLTATNTAASAFTEWAISGEYEVVGGSLTSNTITIRPLSGSVEVNAMYETFEPDFTTYGDADGNGAINMLDVLLIRKYIAKQPVKPNLTASDVTADGNVNMLDVLLIRKFIAKQPVILGPQK